MRIELILIIISIVLSSEAFAADIYIWPNIISDEKTRSCQKEAATLDSLRQQNLIPNRDDPTTYQADKILDQLDLNGDGICELFVQNTKTSGTGGYIQGLFKKNGEKYELIADLFGFDLQLAEKVNGYYQLVYHKVYASEGGKSEYPSLYQFNGKEYVQVKAPSTNSNQYNAKGVDYYRKKDYKTAILYFTNALRVRVSAYTDRGYNIKNNLSLCYIKMKDYGKAEQILNEILTSINKDRSYAGDAAAAYFNLGIIAEEKKYTNQALAYYKLSFAADPSETRRQKINKLESRR